MTNGIHATQSVIGMVPVAVTTGIATRATKGIGGGRGRRRAAKSDTRKFDGKKYKLANWHAKKSVAERDAEHFRRAGHSARVVKSYNARMKKWGYMVYVR